MVMMHAVPYPHHRLQTEDQVSRAQHMQDCPLLAYLAITAWFPLTHGVCLMAGPVYFFFLLKIVVKKKKTNRMSQTVVVYAFNPRN